MLAFRTVQISFFPLILVLAVFSRYRESEPTGVLFVGWFVSYIAAGIWLNRFRCPRCGKLYYWDLRWKESLARYRSKSWRPCRHCGLQQDACPV